MTFWKTRRVLITGATGFIGAHLSKALLEQGARVTGYDLSTKGILDDLGVKIPVVHGDILDTEHVNDEVAGADVVFHLAAYSGVEESRRVGYHAFMVNTVGTLNLLEACTAAKKPLVLASSNHVYGHQPPGPVCESAALNQLDTYSASKIACDVIARAYAHNYDTQVVVVRNTNCYGPADPHHDHLIPGAILSVLRGETPVIRGQGKTQKSYLYIDDVISAYLLLAEALCETPQRVSGRAFNVADAARPSVRAVVASILDIMEAYSHITVQGKPDDQTNEELCCCAIEALGWKPRYSLREGIKLTSDWYAAHMKQEAKA